MKRDFDRGWAKGLMRGAAMGPLILVIVALLFAPPTPVPPSAQHDPVPHLAQRLPDAHYLQHVADSAGLKRSLVWAVAWTESRGNLNPKLRGHHCKARPNCEVGRFQIKPVTAAYRCPKINTRTYKGNVACAMKMLAEDGGGERALRRWIGTGLGAQYQRAYVDKVMALVGRMEVGQ